MILKNAKIVLEDRIINQGWIEIKQNKIKSINEGKTNAEGIDLNNNWLLPGFIDCHVHGGYGVDFEFGDENRFTHFSQNLVKEGVTSYVQASVTNSLEDNLKYLKTFKNFMSMPENFGAKCLGVHFEGPYISAERKGAHELGLLTKPSVKEFKKILDGNGEIIKMITYAPELQDGSFTKFLIANNILPSAGHSNLIFNQFERDYQLGIRHVTHLFNGMSGVTQRDSGLAAAALYFDDVLCELITDGIHIDPDMIKLTYKIKGYLGICIITDAMNAKGLADGNYKLGNLNVTKEGIKVYLTGSGTLAGAGATYDHNVRTVLKTIPDLNMSHLIHMTSINVAKQLKIFDKTGSIAVNKAADFAVLNSNFEITHTFVEGVCKYRKEEK